MSGLTAKTILDLARSRHPAFLAEHAAPDGALLVALDARQRLVVLRYGSAIDGLVNTTVDVATTINGALVGSDNGTPVYLTTYADGWPVHQTNDGVPYADFTEQTIAHDPFGVHGGTPGFPLPSDFVKLVGAAYTSPSGSVGAIDVITESARFERNRSGRPIAFVSGNRLVPVGTSDVWRSGVASLQLSYIALPRLTSVTDAILLPAVLMDILIAGLAEHLAMTARGLSVADKQSLVMQARAAESTVELYSVDLVGAVTQNTVHFRG